MPLPEALAKARNHYSALHRRSIKAIWDFMFEPSAETWDKIYGIMINPDCKDRRIVWLAVIAVDPTFPSTMYGAPEDPNVPPRLRWPQVPNRFIVARAIQEAVDCSGEIF